MGLFSDYDMRFFIEQHLGRCPVTGKPENLKAVRETDPAYKPLPAEHKWDPKSCPSYRPRQEPKFARYTIDARERLIGLWVSRNPGGQSNEILVLSSDGTGMLDFWNATGCYERRPLKWRLEGVEQIRFDGSGNYFQTDNPDFEIGLFTDAYGDERDTVRVFDSGRDGRRTEFSRSMESLEDYNIRRSESGGYR